MEKQNQELLKQMKLQQTSIRNNKRDNCFFAPKFLSKEEAILEFLKDLQKTSKEEVLSMTSIDENLYCIYPNIIGYGTSLDNTLLADYVKLMKERTNIGLSSIRKKIKSSAFKIKTLTWEKARRYEGISGYKPFSIIIENQGKEYEITEIKMVYSMNGTFKVGVIGF